MAYVYQEFPRVLYREGGTRVVVDAADKEAALRDGWYLQPLHEAEAADARLQGWLLWDVTTDAPAKRGPGRPRKVA